MARQDPDHDQQELGDDSDFLPAPSASTDLDLTRIVAHHSFRKEDAIDAISNIHRNIQSALTKEAAILAAKAQLQEMERQNRAPLLKQLEELAASPLISKDTQAAFFKTILLDYVAARRAGDTTVGPALKDVLSAAKLLNETYGLADPIKTETKHDITLHSFPVAQAPFRGELPELEVIDAQVTAL